MRVDFLLLLVVCPNLSSVVHAAQEPPQDSQSLLALAEKRFGSLTNAEQKLFLSVGNDRIADFTSATEAENDLSRPELWGSDREIDADRIEWLCTVSETTLQRLRCCRFDGQSNSLIRLSEAFEL